MKCAIFRLLACVIFNYKNELRRIFSVAIKSTSFCFVYDVSFVMSWFCCYSISNNTSICRSKYLKAKNQNKRRNMELNSKISVSIVQKEEVIV